MAYLSFYLLTFMLSILFTGCVRQYALSKNLLDIPNARSSHERPTPLGGGLAFVVLFMGGLFFFYSREVISSYNLIAFFIPCFVVSLLGFIDDKIDLPAIWRFLGHIGACYFAVLFLGALPPLIFGTLVISSSTILFILTILYLAWLLNLFNFMDGIDGLAAMEAIVASLGMIFIYLWQGQMNMVWLPLCLAVSVTGFLEWTCEVTSTGVPPVLKFAESFK